MALGELPENFVNRGSPGAERERGKIGDRQAAELDRQRFGAQALAMACAAERGGHVLRYPLAIAIGVGLFEISFQKLQDSRETKTFVGFGFLTGRSVLSRASVGRRVAVQKHVLDARGKFFKRRFEIEAVRVSSEF